MTEEKTKKTTKKKSVKSSERAKIEDIEKIVVDLAKKGYTPSKIGVELKEKYGVDKIKVLGTRVSQILKKNNIEYKKDLDLVNDKINKIENHTSKNNQDKRSKRELVRFIGLRKKLEKYQSKKLA